MAGFGFLPLFLPWASEHRFLRSHSFSNIARHAVRYVSWPEIDVRGLLQQPSLTPSPRRAQRSRRTPRAKASQQ